MSLDRSKLQKVRELGNGSCQAQCPACAEAGQDRKGEHLRISPDGKFGCCVFPGDRKHRSRIFALAGDFGPKAIKVRVAPARAGAPVQLDLLGRLGRAFGSPERRMENEKGRTEQAEETLGTPGTGFLNPRAYASETEVSVQKLIENQEPVPSVPEEIVPPVVRLPYLEADGNLVIPFSAPERYYWWAGGQSIRRTKEEIMERKENDASPF